MADPTNVDVRQPAAYPATCWRYRAVVCRVGLGGHRYMVHATFLDTASGYTERQEVHPDGDPAAGGDERLGTSIASSGSVSRSSRCSPSYALLSPYGQSSEA